MDYMDIKVGQKVRCVYGSSCRGKTATIVGAPTSPHGQITVVWDDGTVKDTVWSYASSFEPAEVPPEQKNNICCICGYPDEWIASKNSTPACRVCAPKIAFGDPNPTLEKIKEEADLAPTGNGFSKSKDPEIALIKEAFTNLQDRTQYKPGDRIQIRIKNGKDVWATVVLLRDTDCLLFLDEAYDTETHRSWATLDHLRREALQLLGLDVKQARCFFWGDFSPGYSSGTPDITVLGKEIPNLQDRTRYKRGDRIQVSIKGGEARWATVIDHKSVYGTAIFLDEPYQEDEHLGAYSWITRELDRERLIEKLGLDPSKENCIFWGPANSAKVLKEDEVKVLQKLDSAKVASVKATEPAPSAQSFEGGHVDFEKDLKVGDVIQYAGDSPIVGDNPPLVKGKTYRVRKLVPHDGSFKVFLEGFDGENDWWKPFRFQPHVEKIDFGPGDIVRCKNADYPLKKDMLYRVCGQQLGWVFLENGSSKKWLESRFEIFKTVEGAPIKYPVGARIQIQCGKEKGWGTIIGTVFSGEQERPITSMDSNVYWADGKAKSYLTEYGIDFTNTIADLGLNEWQPKCWLALSGEVLQVVPKGSAEVDLVIDPLITIQSNKNEAIPNTLTLNSSGGNIVFSGGINTIPLTFKFEGEKGWKIESDAPITIGKESAPINPETTGVDYAKENIIEELAPARGTTSMAPALEKVLNEAKTIHMHEFWGKGQLFSKEDPKEQSFGSMVKEDAISAGYRVAANQLTKGVKAALLKLMEDRGADNNKVALIREILETEMGNALIAMILGMSLTYIPTLSEDKRAQKLAGEFRIGSMTTTGNALMDMVWQYVKNLPQTEKVRVNTNEVRVAEEPEEEIVEDEKSSSLGV